MQSLNAELSKRFCGPCGSPELLLVGKQCAELASSHIPHLLYLTQSATMHWCVSALDDLAV